MGNWAAWPVVTVAAALGVPAHAQVATLPLPGTEVGIVVEPGVQSEPALSSAFGNFIAYTDHTPNPSEVWYCRLNGLACPAFKAPQPSWYPLRSGNQFAPAVAGDLLVYVDEGPFGPRKGNVVRASLSQGISDLISPFDAFQGSPAVSDRLIAWEDNRDAATGRDIWVHDLLGGQGSWSITGKGFQHGPRVSGRLVSYLDDWDGTVKVYDLGDPPRRGAGTVTVAYPALAAFADIDGTAVVVETVLGDLEVRSMGGLLLAALTLPGRQSNPHISGDWVAFEDNSTQVSRVIVWNWATGNLYAPPAGTSSQTLNDISWPRVVYVDNRCPATGRDIYLWDTSALAGPGGGGPGGGTGCGHDDDGADDDRECDERECDDRECDERECDHDGEGEHRDRDGGSEGRCAEVSAAPLAELRLVRRRSGPRAARVEFDVEVGTPALACIDTSDVSSAWVLLDDEAVARPDDFNQHVVHLEPRRTVLGGANRLSAVVAGKPGARLRVRLLADPAGGPAPVAGAGLRVPSLGAPGAEAASGQGCSGGTAGLAAALPLWAWLLRRRRTGA